MPETRYRLRQESIQKLKQDSFDILIAGGGINGAAAASALSHRGIPTALIDKGDFACSTSQESSNLIWGGIKYLENLELGLVYRLCSARNQLLCAFPSSIKEIRFLAMIERGHRHPWTIFAGSLLYWLMGSLFTRRPRYMRPATLKKEEPTLNTERCLGGVEYSDAYLIDHDASFVFQFIDAAVDRGAVAVNYMELLQAHRQNSCWEIVLRDNTNMETFHLRAKVLINACGPYVDQVNEICSQKTKHQHLFSKGVHLVVPSFTSHSASLEPRRILAFFASDMRLFFAIPMGDRYCIGTTDTPVDRLPVQAEAEDRNFILENVNRCLSLPRPLGKNDIISERCGVRPLAIEKKRQRLIANRDWSSLSRRHIIEIDPSRCHISIFGGKLTDCINVGQEVGAAVRQLGIIDSPILVQRRASVWYGEPSARARSLFIKEVHSMDMKKKLPLSPEIIGKRLWRLYGVKAWQILRDIQRSSHLGELLIEGNDLLQAELAHIARWGMVVKLEDFLRRRSQIGLVNEKDSLRKSSAIRDVSKILFQERASEKWEEYFGRF